MRRPARILYVGTYEADYPRNVLTIAALRRAGCVVQTAHRTVWPDGSDKSAMVRSPKSMLVSAARLAGAYPRLAASVIRQRDEVDVLAFGYIGQLDLLALGLLARLLRKPILFDPLVTLTDTLIEDRRRLSRTGLAATIVRAIDRLALRFADVILTDTDEDRAYLMRAFGVSGERCRVVPVGADERVFSPQSMTAPLGVDERLDVGPTSLPSNTQAYALRVLFYGTMIPLQGVDTIVRAAKLLEGQIDVRFEIIGRGQVERDVKLLARHLETINVTFIDHVPYHELPSRIASADVLLGIFGDTAKAGRVVPNKVYQAMAMGAAIVTRDSAAVRRLLTDGGSVLLVPPADPAALAAAIRRLKDRDLRRRLGERARERFLETASGSVQAEAMGEVLSVLLGDSLRLSYPVTQ